MPNHNTSTQTVKNSSRGAAAQAANRLNTPAVWNPREIFCKKFRKGIADSHNVCIFAMPNRSISTTTNNIATTSNSVPLRCFSSEMLRFGDHKGVRPLYTYVKQLFYRIMPNRETLHAGAKNSTAVAHVQPTTRAAIPLSQGRPATGILEKFSAKFLQDKKFCVLLSCLMMRIASQMYTNRRFTALSLFCIQLAVCIVRQNKGGNAFLLHSNNLNF